MRKNYQWMIVAIAALLLPVVASIGFTKASRQETASTGNRNEKEAGFELPRAANQSPTTIPLSPEESLQSFRLPQGYHLELVASEPMISAPVAVAWDGNGRMYVSQMEAYGANKTGGRIMLLEDTDDDGKMDKSSVFLENGVSPRMLLCIGNELLLNEPNTTNIYAYKDVNGDGRADRKRTVFRKKKKIHRKGKYHGNGLDWNLDNYIYLTTDPIRFRYTGKGLRMDSLPYGNNGQWGITHDNYGRLFYSRATAGIAACGFQINPVYGQLELIDKYENSSFNAVWSIPTSEVCSLNAESTLVNFTAACGQSVFRGDRLPKNMSGDYLVAEPAGRLIRRAKVIEHEGKVSLRNVYAHDEFITSTDPNFSPVNTYTGPDGCLYIVDMYQGMAKGVPWEQPDNSSKKIKKGRIYRLVHEEFRPGPKPRMLHEITDTLLNYLDHPNGWWRDNAQKEIIARGDKCIVPVLKQIVLEEKASLPKKPSGLARLHALYTLDGLEDVDLIDIQAAMEDRDAQVRRAAVRLSEPFLKNDDIQVIEWMEQLMKDPCYDVRIQLLLSLHYSRAEEAKTLIRKIFISNPMNELMAGIENTFARNEERKMHVSKLLALREHGR